MITKQLLRIKVRDRKVNALRKERKLRKRYLIYSNAFYIIFHDT